MTRKSWYLDRRSVIRGAAATLALPLLDAMCWGSEAATIARSKKRFCAFYFPFGVPSLPEGHRLEQWDWYPKDLPGGAYQFREIMKPLDDLKSQVTVFKGLYHKRLGAAGGHDSADGFLTGTPIKAGVGKNTVSVDQVLAEKFGNETRFSSLVLSLDGGVGKPARSSTLSYNKDGSPIPAQSNLRRIFDRMFSASSQKEMLAELRTNKSILDDVLESAKNLKNNVGRQDQLKVEEYLTSVRELEQRIQKQESWIGKPLPKIDTSALALEATLADPKNYLKSMFELIFLAFQTDMTRYATFQIGNQENRGLTWEWTISLGMKSGHHGLAHAMDKDDGPAHYGAYLQYLTGEYAAFLQRLKNVNEGTGTMLDHTFSMFGCSNGNPTHSIHNLPIIAAGGTAMGFKQGQYLKFHDATPLANLYTTILDKLGAPQNSFADSTGQIDALNKG